MLKLPLSWIRQYIELPQQPEEIRDTLTEMGLEVEAMEGESFPFQDVVVARVTSVTPHPNADKLCVAQVFDGEQTFQVVCGAPNCQEGLVTAFARPGAVLEDGSGETFTIQKTKLRAVESCGMLCSAQELGVSDAHEGILDLDATTPLGTPLETLHQDLILTIAITPNLGHALSLQGVLRELAAGFGIPYTPLSIQPTPVGVPSHAPCGVEVDCPEECPQYACRVVENVLETKTPVWMQRRLKNGGIRSVNLLVDITNYVMLEMGQPMHAFDYEAFQGSVVRVRKAMEGESLTTLDGMTISLDAEHVVICDAQGPVALAGVMGGERTQVTSKTRHVLFESAYFMPGSIRQTAKAFHFSTESSKRFERGVDYNQVQQALDRACMLLEEITGVAPCDQVVSFGPAKESETFVHCRLKRVQEILGIHLSLDEVEKIFLRLGLSATWDGKSTFRVKIPSYRHDLLQEIDLIEEIVRVHGYRSIPIVPTTYTGSRLPNAPIYTFEQEVKKSVLAQGFQETITCDLISPREISWVQQDLPLDKALVHVQNPSSIDQSILRPTLLPSLLSVAIRNFDHQAPHLNIFEIGKIHFRHEEHFKEQSVIAFLMSGPVEPSHWDIPARMADFFDLKGVCENVFQEFRVSAIQFTRASFHIYHPGRCAKISSGGVDLGSLGQLHPKLQAQLDLPHPVILAQINLHQLYPCVGPKSQMTPLSLYPASTRDWTMTLKEEDPVQPIIEQMLSIDSKYLESVSLKSIYRSDKLGEKKKNVTFHLVYRDQKKTLAQHTIDLEHAKVTEKAMEYMAR